MSAIATKVDGGLMYGNVSFASNQTVPTTENASVTRASVTLPAGLYLFGGYQYTNTDQSGNTLVFDLLVDGSIKYSNIRSLYPGNPVTLQFVKAYRLNNDNTTVAWNIRRRSGSYSLTLNNDGAASFGWYVRLSD